MGRITINDIIALKKSDKRISMLTAYDFYSAKFVDQAGVDIILVGDSLGMVIQGREDTLAVSIDDMVYHTTMVKRGSKRALIVTDLPFMSYQISKEEALKNAGRIMKEAGAGAVKLEGGKNVVSQIKAIVDTGIPVMGHLGLTPQSVHQLGGYRVQAKGKEQALKLIEDALVLQDAGVFAIVLETIPLELAKLVSEKLDIPTIGIGAGLYCDGQVLVFHDLLGYDQDFKPKFVRNYSNLNQIITEDINKYINDINTNQFPNDEESYHMNQQTIEEVKKELDKDGYL